MAETKMLMLDEPTAGILSFWALSPRSCGETWVPLTDWKDSLPGGIAAAGETPQHSN